MTKKEEFMKISSYEEFVKKRKEFEGVKIDKEMLLHASNLFPKTSNTKEELYKTPLSKGGSIGR